MNQEHNVPLKNQEKKISYGSITQDVLCGALVFLDISSKRSHMINSHWGIFLK